MDPCVHLFAAEVQGAHIAPVKTLTGVSLELAPSRNSKPERQKIELTMGNFFVDTKSIVLVQCPAYKRPSELINNLHVKGRNLHSARVELA